MDNIKTPQQLLDYMMDNFEYGWVGIDGSRHVENLENFKTLYRISSLDKVFESRLVTCIETAILAKEFLDSKNIENKLFCHRAYKTDENKIRKIKMHIIILYKEKDNWMNFEYSRRKRQGLHPFASLENALDELKEELKNEGQERELKEIYDLPLGLTFKELNEYVDNLDIVKQR